MNLCTSVFVYVGSIGLYKRIVNADTQSIRIANADGQGLKILLACSVKLPPPSGTPSYPRGRVFLFVIQYVTKAPPLG